MVKSNPAKGKEKEKEKEKEGMGKEKEKEKKEKKEKKEEDGGWSLRDGVVLALLVALTAIVAVIYFPLIMGGRLTEPLWRPQSLVEFHGPKVTKSVSAVCPIPHSHFPFPILIPPLSPSPSLPPSPCCLSPPQLSSKAHEEEFFWGTYRPQVYFGVRARVPQSLLFGMMWTPDEGPANLRHTCEQGDLLKRYGWNEHDGSSYGSQIIEDHGQLPPDTPCP